MLSIQNVHMLNKQTNIENVFQKKHYPNGSRTSANALAECCFWLRGAAQFGYSGGAGTYLCYNPSCSFDLVTMSTLCTYERHRERESISKHASLKNVLFWYALTLNVTKGQ